MVFFHKKIWCQQKLSRIVIGWSHVVRTDTPTFLYLKEALGLWASGQFFFFFMDFICDWSRSFLPANKVLLHSALKTPGDFLIFEIFCINQEKRSRLYDNGTLSYKCAIVDPRVQPLQEGLMSGPPFLSFLLGRAQGLTPKIQLLMWVVKKNLF